PQPCRVCARPYPHDCGYSTVCGEVGCAISAQSEAGSLLSNLPCQPGKVPAQTCEPPTATQPPTRDLDPSVDSLGSIDPMTPKGMRRPDPITNSPARTVKGKRTPRPPKSSSLWNVWAESRGIPQRGCSPAPMLRKRGERSRRGDRRSLSWDPTPVKANSPREEIGKLRRSRPAPSARPHKEGLRPGKIPGKSPGQTSQRGPASRPVPPQRACHQAPSRSRSCSGSSSASSSARCSWLK
ncbi:MAG: hypothetical protein ACI8S6_002806, partial [Myxococcota bacterium]